MRKDEELKQQRRIIERSVLSASHGEHHRPAEVDRQVRVRLENILG